MKNKQGCVDWLVEEINKQKAWAEPLKLDPIIQQAKAMHKEEIEDAWNGGDYAYFYSKETGRDFTDGKEYYNERFGGNNE